MRRTCAFAVAAAGIIAAISTAASPPARSEGAAKDVIITTLPGIVVDTKAREVRLKGTMLRPEGPLELFVCSEHTREHESAIVVQAKPSNVTFALALLDLPPGQPGYTTPGGAFSPPAGDVLEILVRYAVETTEGGSKHPETREVPAWKLLKLAGSETVLDRPIDWVYVGQPDARALRAADHGGTVVCLSNFPEAVIDVPFESTSVNANLLYDLNRRDAPPAGTPVELVIRPTGRRIQPRKVEIEVSVRKGQPIMLDGKPIEPAALKEALNAMPAEVRTAVLRADPDERFGRVMEVHDLLRDALMKVTLSVLQAPAAPAAVEKPAAVPLEIRITPDDKVNVAGKTLTVAEFRAKAAELLKGVERVNLAPDAKAAAKTVAEVMSIARDQGAFVALVRSDQDNK